MDSSMYPYSIGKKRGVAQPYIPSLEDTMGRFAPVSACLICQKLFVTFFFQFLKVSSDYWGRAQPFIHSEAKNCYCSSTPSRLRCHFF